MKPSGSASSRLPYSWRPSTWISFAFIRSATATGASRGYCCSCNATTWGSRWAATSAWSVSSRRTRNGTMKPWSNVPAAGTRANTTPGHISITSSSSSRPRIRNSKSASAGSISRKAKKRTWSCGPLTGKRGLSALAKFRMSARMSAWI